MNKILGGEAVVEVLIDEGVENVFGLIGSSTLEIYDKLFDTKEINYIGNRHEACSGLMADAYGRVSGRPGVCLAGQNGPGATNLVTGLSMANFAYSPVVALVGAADTRHMGRDSFQELDQQTLLTPVTKKTLSVMQAEQIPELVREAFHIATSGRPGPVAVNIPRNMLAKEIEPVIKTGGQEWRKVRSPAEPALVESAVRMLTEASRPVILAGAGVKWARASRSLMKLAERLSCPVVASAGHGDVVPSDFDLYGGQVGPRGNWVATKAIKDADVVLALGTRLGFSTTFYSHDSVPKTVRIIQVDIDPIAVGRYFPVEVGIVGDAECIAQALLAAIPERTSNNTKAWVGEFQENKKELRQQRQEAAEDAAVPMKPGRVFAELNRVLPRSSIVTLDGGTLCLQAADQLSYHETPALLTQLDFGLVGFSFAAGLGAKIAAPDRPVVSLMGDGGLSMVLGEIGTAVAHDIATVAIVLNNSCWGAEKAYQRDFYGERYIGADIINPRFDLVAQSFGARGAYVERPEQIGPVVEEALQSGTCTVIEIPMDPDAMISFRRDAFVHKLKT